MWLTEQIFVLMKVKQFCGWKQIEEVILIYFTEIDKVLNSELWDSKLSLLVVQDNTRQVFEFQNQASFRILADFFCKL